MTFCVENETNQELPFDVEDILGKVIERALEQEGCPYEANVAVLLTDNEGIHAMNKEFRQIDKPTDVLSFPNVDYDAPADFTGIEDYVEDYFDPETGELILGDIVISIDKVYEQAKEYGHAPLREFAFLVAHLSDGWTKSVYALLNTVFLPYKKPPKIHSLRKYIKRFCILDFLQIFKQIFCFVLFRSFLYIQNFYFYTSCSKTDFNDVTDIYICGCFRNLIIDQNSSCIAGFIGNGASFDQSGNFQVLVQAHRSN